MRPKRKISPDTIYQKTVHDEIVAEIKQLPVIRLGEAAAKLLALRKQRRAGKKKYPISEEIKEYLYIAEDRP
jgi:hypothetical protein